MACFTAGGIIVNEGCQILLSELEVCMGSDYTCQSDREIFLFDPNPILEPVPLIQIQIYNTVDCFIFAWLNFHAFSFQDHS